MPEELAVFGALVITMIWNFFTIRAFVFGVRGKVSAAQFTKFVMTTVGARGLEYVVFLLLFAFVGLGYLVALFVALTGSFFAKYWLHSRIFLVG